MSEELKEVDVAAIGINPYQPRRHFAKEDLEELSLSIKAVGLLHPPVVRQVAPNSYELISGERRYRALQMTGLKKIPVIIRSSSSSHSAQAALIENVQRVDLNPMEIANSLSRLMREFDYSQEDLALKIGKKRSTIANYLRLLTLPSPIQESIRLNTISMGHAKAILALEKGKQQEVLHEIILRDQLSVRKAEEMAHKMQVKREAPRGVEGNVQLERLGEELQRKLGTKVVIQGGYDRGRITIDYYSLEELELILKGLGWEAE